SVKMAGARGYLDDLIASEIAALENLLQTVAQEEIDKAADMIFEAKRIFLFGQGHAQSILSFLQRRLDRFGMVTTALGGRGRDIAERIVSLRPSDLVLGMAFRKQPESYYPLMVHARDAGAKTILISDLSGLS